MRIRTRLFLLIALLVLAVVGLQWWLGLRQIETTQEAFVAVASTVGHRLVAELQVKTAESATATSSQGMRAPALGKDPSTTSHVVVLTTMLSDQPGEASPTPGTAIDEPLPSCEVLVEPQLDLQVVRGKTGEDRFLVIKRPGGPRLIPIPMAAPTRRARLDLQRGLLLSGGLLAAGLLAAAVIAHRVTGPLRQLAAGVESVGRGGFQTRVPITGSGEVGDLQKSFNAMATRLAALESERETWRAREHLAELGDLARGLAHTLRNPLNTLGLAVEELAGRTSVDDQRLVATARAQIRRVDRWLLSFLALGAGQGIDPEGVDLNDLAGEVVLEAVQTGALVALDAAPEPVVVCVIPGALRAALANLVENAAQASPEGGTVSVGVALEGPHAVLRVADRGPGLPAEVRLRLFEPHVTTRVGGAGMGLFLARQLVEAGLGGRLEVRDRAGGGTEAIITLDASKPRPAAHVS